MAQPLKQNHPLKGFRHCPRTGWFYNTETSIALHVEEQVNAAKAHASTQLAEAHAAHSAEMDKVMARLAELEKRFPVKGESV